MENKPFIKAINKSFKVYLDKGLTGARSSEKLKPLHGFIAREISERLGPEYTVKSLGFGPGKEHTISGKFIDKKVDITILKDNAPVAGIAVKFIMSNYSQNSNNYFEAMLGETVNLRTKNVPYFHVIILTNRCPYFGSAKKTKNGREVSFTAVKKIEHITEHNLDKYRILSLESLTSETYSPDKSLLFFVTVKDDSMLPLVGEEKKDYIGRMSRNAELVQDNCFTNQEFGDNLIRNDFPAFIDAVSSQIKDRELRTTIGNQ